MIKNLRESGKSSSSSVEPEDEVDVGGVGGVGFGEPTATADDVLLPEFAY